MSTSARLRTSGTPPEDLDELRKAEWLLSPYSDDVWTVRDTFAPFDEDVIDFRQMMADGRLLPDHPRLYATVKEHAWWMRSTRFGRIHSAKGHAQLSRHMAYIAHRLTMLNIQSFSQIEPFDIENFLEDCVIGLDGVVSAGARMSAFLQPLLATGEDFFASARTERRIFDGTDRVSRPVVVAACSLPAGTINVPSVSRAIDAVAVQLRLELSKRNWRQIGGAEADAYDPPIITIASLTRWLQVIEDLFFMRHAMKADGLKFLPFPQGVAKVSQVKGVETKRTPIVPPRLMFELLEAAAKVVADGSVVLNGVLPTSDHIATACWILIALFTARRAGEIAKLTAQKVEGDERTGYYLRMFILKTDREETLVPIPPIVAVAFETLEKLSAEAREESGFDTLFLKFNAQGEVIENDISRKIDSFAKAFGVGRLLEGLQNWHFTPHQFRRFFAVLYYYRFEDASIEALSYHLRHHNMEMTRHYLTQDPELAALWTDVEWGYQGHIARKIVASGRSVGGAQGARLKKAARRIMDVLRRNVAVVAPERVASALKAFMQREGLVITPKAWVDCSCPRTAKAAHAAACRKLGPPDPAAVGPDYSRAGPTVCGSGCRFAIESERTAAALASEQAHLASAVASSTRPGTLFGELEQRRLVEVESIQMRRKREENEGV